MNQQSDRSGGDELCTLADVAQLLRVPPATLRYWRHLGTGPRSFRIGRHVRYYRGDVEAWLQEQRGQGSTGGEQRGRQVGTQR